MNKSIALALFLAPTVASATATIYTNAGQFHAANPSASLIDNFDGSDPAMREVPLSSYTTPGGEVTFSPISSYPFDPNLWLDTPGHTDVAADLSPTTSVMLTATGNEDWVATLASPAYALGFDVYLNEWPLNLSFFNGTTLLGTINFGATGPDANHEAFAGISSAEGVTSFRWEALNGQYHDTGIDNVLLAPALPEPSTWAMMLIGFAAIGLTMRCSKAAAANSATSF